MRLQLKRGTTSQARDPYRLDSLRSKSPRLRYYRRSHTAWYTKSRCLPEQRRHQCTMHSECCEKQEPVLDPAMNSTPLPATTKERNIIRILQKNSDIAYPPGKHWCRVCCKLNIYLTGIFCVIEFSRGFIHISPNFFWLPPPLSRLLRTLVDKKRTHEVCRHLLRPPSPPSFPGLRDMWIDT